MNETSEIYSKAGAEEVGTRLDLYCVAQLEEATRAEVQRLIELPEEAPQGIRVNGGTLKNRNYKLRLGDRIEIERPEIKPATAKAEKNSDSDRLRG